MQRIFLLLGLVALALSACAANEQEPPNAVDADLSGPVLTVSIGDQDKVYTQADLEALGGVEAQEGDIVYVGVLLRTLLADAGVDPTSLTAVKAVAVDGFSANFGSDLFLADTTLVAYARLDGPLADDEGPFRIVAPGQGGKMNPRMLASLIAIK